MSAAGRTRQTVARVVRRNLHGVLLLDKPHGCSSNDALHQAKRHLNAKKAGHTGTLDPLATGLLPLCFGEATKFSHDLLHADKTYLASIQLGVTRAGGDLEGEILQERSLRHDAAGLAQVLARFTGQITQMPPMHSALKKDGVALYTLARQGIEVERSPRRVMVHQLDLLLDGGDRLEICVRVSKGTYIRTLAEDIGEALGCGAHLLALRRTAVGPLQLQDGVTLDHLKSVVDGAQLLLPVDALVQDVPGICLSEIEAQRVLQGQRLAWSGPEQGTVRMMGLNRFLGLAQIDAGRLQPVRILNFD